jgi:branched-subunit amino acid transport protein
MSATWTTIGVLTLVTAAIKGAGPLVLGGRGLPEWAVRLISLVAPALLGALVVVETLGDGKELVIDARIAGITAALVALAARLSVLWAVGAAAAAAALVRLIG